VSKKKYQYVPFHDDGNQLVLADDAGSVLWQSFEHLTNTFLSRIQSGTDFRTDAPSGSSPRTCRSADDPSAGDFR
jgi:hypothetical protein